MLIIELISYTGMSIKGYYQNYKKSVHTIHALEHIISRHRLIVCIQQRIV